MIGKLTALTLVSCLFLVALPLFSQNGQAVTYTTTIYLDQSENAASVAPGQSGVVTFTGYVTCVQSGIGDGMQDILVSLTAAAGGWATTITPATISFYQSNESQPFCIDVLVPPETSSSIRQELIVGGVSRVVPGATGKTLKEVKAMVTVDQFYYLDVNCTTPQITRGPGGSAVFDIIVVNKGNGQDNVRMEVADGQTDLDGAGITIIMGKTEFVVPEGGNTTVTVSLYVPKDYSGEQVFMLKLKFYSYTALSMGEVPFDFYYPLYLRADSSIEGGGTPGFEAGLALLCLMMAMAVIAAIDRRRFVH